MMLAGAISSQQVVDVAVVPITVDDFSSAAQNSFADPWPNLTHALGASADYLVAIIASISTHTFAVTAGGVAMNAGPTAGPGDGTNGFVRSFYLLDADLPAAGNIAISVNPSNGAARGAIGVWSLIGTEQTELWSLRTDADIHALGPTTTVSLATVPVGAAILSGFVNNTSGSASSVAGEETENANFDGVGGAANQIFASDTPAASSTITHTFTSPSVASSYTAALMVEILPEGGEEPPPPPPAGALDVFAPAYAGYDADVMAAADIPWNLGTGFKPITHLLHFAAMPQVISGVSSISMTHFMPALDPAAILSSRTAAGSTAKLLLGIGGANTNTVFINAIDNDRPEFIADIVTKVVANGYDGVDTDWEIWQSDTASVDRFINFHNALHAALIAEDPDLILTSSSLFRFAGAYNTALDRIRDEMLDSLEFAWIQGYAFAAPGFSQSTVWHHSSLHITSDYGTTAFAVAQDETIADYVINHSWPLNKIVVGCQYGGRRWTGGSMTSPVAGQGAQHPTQRWISGGTAPGINNEELYREIIALPQYPGDLERDVAAGNIPFIGHNEATSANDFFLPYDDELSLQTKAAYFKALGIRGMGCWHLGSGFVASGATAILKNPLTAALAAEIGGHTMTIGEMSGGGNILHDSHTVEAHKITDLATLHCGMARISAASPTNQYFQGETPTPGNFDGVVVALLEAGIQPYFSFVFTHLLDSAVSGVPARNYADWFAIGAAFAARFRAGSAFLVSQGVTDLGVYGYSAINEPDVNSGEIIANPPTTFGLTYVEYHNMLEGLADGVLSEDSSGRVFPAGYLSGNRDSQYTGHGYCLAVADLINDGKLAGFDLHTYHSMTGAKIHDTWGRSHQSDVDAFISACGITRENIDIICTETNIRGDPDATTQGYTEATAREWFLTSMFDVWGTVRPDGQIAKGPRFPWQLWTTGNVVFHMASQESPRIELWCGHTYKMLMDLLWDMRFTFSDPRDTGVMKLEGGGKHAWVFQNIHSTWTSLSGSTFTISDIPTGTTQVAVYDGNGLITTVTTPTLQIPSHQFSTPNGKSYLFVGNN